MVRVERDVEHRIGELVVEAGQRGRTRSCAGAMLMPASPPTRRSGAEILVRLGRDGADRELAIQLGQRRRPEPGFAAPQTLTRSVA